MRRLAIALLLAVVLAPPPVGAQAPDPAAGDALAATLQMLLDPALRAAAVAGSPRAGAADQQIRGLTGSDALTEELFALAADVLRELTQATDGDATAMAQALDRARTDPGGFAATLSPRTLERLRQLSLRISDQRR